MTHGAIEVPFGGRKEGGPGQVNGAEGVRGCTRAQPILTDRFGGRRAASSYP